MIIGDVLLDVMFFILISVFIYFNIVAQDNFLKSYTIIVEDPDPICSANPVNLPDINIDDLEKCSNEDFEPYYIYKAEEDNLIFVVSTNQNEARNFSTICNHYCPKLNDNGNCVSESGKSLIPYENCIDLLDPEENCSNSSAPLAADLKKNTFLWAIKATDSIHAC